jgi:hypothetical protein
MAVCAASLFRSRVLSRVVPFISPRNGPLAHIPLVGEPEDEPKADWYGGDKAEGRNGEDGQPFLAHDAER